MKQVDSLLINYGFKIFLGYKKPIESLTQQDISEIIDILKCHCIKLSIPEINQFCEGLETLNVLTYVKEYPDIMRELFVDDGIRLTTGKYMYDACNVTRL